MAGWYSMQGISVENQRGNVVSVVGVGACPVPFADYLEVFCFFLK